MLASFVYVLLKSKKVMHMNWPNMVWWRFILIYEEFITGRCDSRLSGSEGQLLFCGIHQYVVFRFFWFWTLLTQWVFVVEGKNTFSSVINCLYVYIWMCWRVGIPMVLMYVSYIGKLFFLWNCDAYIRKRDKRIT